MASYELRARDMTLGSCESMVEQRVCSLDGVEAVDADSRAQTVVLDRKEELNDAIATRIENTGYDVVN